MADFITLRKYPTKAEAEDLGAQLADSGIEFRIENLTPPVDITFTGNLTLQQEFAVKVPETDFDAAKKVMEEAVAASLDQLPDEYYLFDFSEDELYEVLKKADEWSELDVQLARKILRERGETVDDAHLEAIRKSRLQELSKPPKDESSWISSGYWLAFLMPMIGILLGFFMMQGKKTLPDGQRVYFLSANGRRHGRNVMLISGALILLLAGLYVGWIGSWLG